MPMVATTPGKMMNVNLQAHGGLVFLSGYSRIGKSYNGEQRCQCGQEAGLAYVYQEFPKWKYHPKLGGKIVQNADEEKALGRGWYNRPNEFPKPSATALALNEKVKPW